MVVLLVILGTVFRGPIMMLAGMAFMTPEHSFSEDQIAPPNYADASYWGSGAGDDGDEDWRSQSSHGSVPALT